MGEERGTPVGAKVEGGKIFERVDGTRVGDSDSGTVCGWDFRRKSVGDPRPLEETEDTSIDGADSPKPPDTPRAHRANRRELLSDAPITQY